MLAVNLRKPMNSMFLSEMMSFEAMSKRQLVTGWDESELFKL